MERLNKAQVCSMYHVQRQSKINQEFVHLPQYFIRFRTICITTFFCAPRYPPTYLSTASCHVMIDRNHPSSTLYPPSSQPHPHPPPIISKHNATILPILFHHRRRPPTPPHPPPPLPNPPSPSNNRLVRSCNIPLLPLLPTHCTHHPSRLRFLHRPRPRPMLHAYPPQRRPSQLQQPPARQHRRCMDAVERARGM